MKTWSKWSDLVYGMVFIVCAVVGYLNGNYIVAGIECFGAGYLLACFSNGFLVRAQDEVIEMYRKREADSDAWWENHLTKNRSGQED